MSTATVYIASPLGFTEAGRYYYVHVLVPALRGTGLNVLDPWGDVSLTEEVERTSAITDTTARLETLGVINERVGLRNEEWIRQCHAVLALLDGAEVDSGTASEVGYAAAIGRPVVGLRSDFRLAGDNEATPINLQVKYFVERSGGGLVASLDDAVRSLRRLVDGGAAAGDGQAKEVGLP